MRIVVLDRLRFGWYDDTIDTHFDDMAGATGICIASDRCDAQRQNVQQERRFWEILSGAQSSGIGLIGILDLDGYSYEAQKALIAG